MSFSALSHLVAVAFNDKEDPHKRPNSLEGDVTPDTLPYAPFEHCTDYILDMTIKDTEYERSQRLNGIEPKAPLLGPEHAHVFAIATQDKDLALAQALEATWGPSAGMFKDVPMVALRVHSDIDSSQRHGDGDDENIYPVGVDHELRSESNIRENDEQQGRTAVAPLAPDAGACVSSSFDHSATSNSEYDTDDETHEIPCSPYAWIKDLITALPTNDNLVESDLFLYTDYVPHSPLYDWTWNSVPTFLTTECMVKDSLEAYIKLSEVDLAKIEKCIQAARKLVSDADEFYRPPARAATSAFGPIARPSVYV